MKKLTLDPIQNTAAQYICCTPQAMLALPMGIGKTAITLQAISTLLASGDVRRCLVVAPLVVAQLTWPAECKKWAFPGGVAIAVGAPTTRQAACEGEAALVIVNYENLAWLAGAGLLARFDMIVFDEVTKLKSPSGRAFKTLRHKLKTIHRRVGLSGTIVTEGLPELYGQYLMLDGGARLGTNKERYLRKWFYPTDYQQRKWLPKPGGEEAIRAAIQDITFTVSEDDYEASLPELKTTTRTFALCRNVMRYYKEMEGSGVIVDLDVEAPNAGVRSQKLRQLAAGFVYGANEVITINTCRTAFLRTLAPWDSPVVVVYNFDEELDQIQAAFPDAECLTGKTASAKRELVARWNAGNVPMLLLHPKSAGHGLNLQFGGHILVWYSRPWSRDQYEQVIARLRRRGQPSPVVEMTILEAENTIDEWVTEVLQTKGDLSDAFMQYLKQGN